LRDLNLTVTEFEQAVFSAFATQKIMLTHLQETLSATESLGVAYNSFSLEYASLSTCLDAIGDIYDMEASSLSSLLLSNQKLFDTTEELSGTLKAIRASISFYFGRQHEWELISEKVNAVRSALLDADQSDQSRLELKHLEEQLSNLEDELVKAKKSLLTEVHVWLDRISCMWRSLLSELVSAQISFHSQGVSRWKECIA